MAEMDFFGGVFYTSPCPEHIRMMCIVDGTVCVGEGPQACVDDRRNCAVIGEGGYGRDDGWPLRRQNEGLAVRDEYGGLYSGLADLYTRIHRHYAMCQRLSTQVGVRDKVLLGSRVLV